MRKLVLLTIILFSNFVLANLYVPGEEATMIVELSDFNGNPIPNANCTGYIFYPNMTLAYVLSLNFDPIAKIYHAKFTVPDTYGTYLEVAVCQFNLFGKNKTMYARKSFVVTSGFDFVEKLVENATINISMNITGNITEALEDYWDDIIGLLLALHSTPETEKYCKDNQTLVIIKNATWTINGKVYNIKKEEPIICPYGCDPERAECLPPPTMQQAYKYAAIAVLIGILIILAKIYFAK